MELQNNVIEDARKMYKELTYIYECYRDEYWSYVELCTEWVTKHKSPHPDWLTNLEPKYPMKALLSKLNSKGFVFAGEGHWAYTAIHKESGLAVKFVGLKCQDPDNYPTYAALAMCKPDNTLFPNIYHIEQTGPVNYFVIMESLTSYDTHMSGLSSIRRDRLNDFYHELKRGCKCTDYSVNRGRLQCDYFDFQELQRFVSNFTAVDLHTGNVMFRENGELVVTDPLSFS